MRALLTIIAVVLTANSAIAAPAATKPSAAALAAATVLNQAIESAERVESLGDPEAICKITVVALSTGILSNRDLKIESAGSLGSVWTTPAVNEAGVAVGFFPCAFLHTVRVREQGLLFSRTIWEASQSETETRRRKIAVQVNVGPNVEQEFRNALGLDRASYEDLMRRRGSFLRQFLEGAPR